ncbi:MAG: hypothetical protein IJK46_00265 [Prevotella sp.]|nr:hypothetical protein [Prevotella sp.]
MNKKLFLLICMAACLQLGHAQNTMESIRQRYTEAKKYIESHQGTQDNDGSDWGEYYHMEARLFLPATGGHKEDVYMYWNEREEDVVYPSHYLTFATSKYNYAARNFYDEYLFDEDGKVAFVYVYDPLTSISDDEPDMEYEFRFYLNKGKLIKAIVKRRADDQQPFTEVYSGTSLKNRLSTVYDQYVTKAECIRKMFIAIEEEAYGN